MSQTIIFKIFSSLLLIFSAFASEADDSRKSMSLGRFSTAPSIDGGLNDSCWKNAEKIELGLLGGKTKSPKEKTTVMLGYDNNNLYVGFRCFDSKIKDISARLSGNGENPVWIDDSVEIFLDVNKDRKSYCQIAVNPRGAKWSGGIKNLTAMASIKDDCWEAEIEIPFSDLDIPPGNGNTWGANFCREQKRLNENSSWADLNGWFHQPSFFGEIVMPDVDLKDIFIQKAQKNLEGMDAELKKTEPLALKLPASCALKSSFTELKGEARSLREKIKHLHACHGSDPQWKTVNKDLSALQRKISSLKSNILPYGKDIENNVLPDSAGFAVGTAKSLDKLRKENISKISYDKPVMINMAKGEYENFQIVINPFDIKELKGVKVEMSDLINKENNSKISASQLKFSQVGWVKTKAPIYMAEYVGYWPDPLLPLDLGNAINIPKGTCNFILWGSVYSPKDIPAGRYSGNIILKAQGYKERKIDICLNIWDFSLPGKKTLKCFMDILHNRLKWWYGEDSMNIFKKYAAFLASYGMDPGRTTIPFLLKKQYSHYIGGKKLKTEEIRELNENISSLLESGVGTIGLGNYNPDSETFREVCKILKDEKLDSISYLFNVDEPNKSQLKAYHQMENDMDKLAPGINRVLSISVGKLGYFPEEIAGTGKIWAINFSGIHYSWPQIAKRQEVGDELCIVSNIGGSPPYPAWCIDEAALDHRIFSWMAWKYNAKFLWSWGVNHWGWNHNWTGENYRKTPKWPDSDWEAMTFNGLNGDGYLVYPGKDGNPISSIRLEVIRDGIEDYEYFHILKTKIDEIRKMDIPNKQELLDESEALLSFEKQNIIRNFNDFNRNPDDMLKHRVRVGRQIEKLNGILKKCQKHIQ